MKPIWKSPRIALTALGTILAFASNPPAKVHHAKDYPSNQAALNALQAGDALVFDKDKGAVAVNAPLTDIQFIGGGNDWDLKADLTDCLFLNHGISRMIQHSGKLRKTIFYASTGQQGSSIILTHADSVMFYYAGGYLWPAWNPDEGKTPQLQFYGFVRGVTIHKTRSGLNGQQRRFDMNWGPALRIYATDPVGNGQGSYIISPILWDQRAWTPFHVVKGTGITLAHVNTEYNVWADPIMDVDNGTRCMILCTGVGSRSSAANNFYTAQPVKLKYWDHEEWGHDGAGAPYRGAVFQMGGQRNKVVAQGSYKTWSIGRKQWLPGLHYADGVVAKDPFFENWPNFAAGLSANFSEPKNVFYLESQATQSNPSARFKYPLEGADIISPVFLRLPDIRYDFSATPSSSEIHAQLDAGQGVNLGMGTFKLTKTLTAGSLTGMGPGKTIVECAAGMDCSQRGLKGLKNLTLKGGRYGYNAQVGTGSDLNILGANFLRVRFDGQSKAGINISSTQNDVIQDCDFMNAEKGIVSNDSEGYSGEGGHGTLNIDKLDIANCVFKNISDAAIKLYPRPGPNGQVAIHNCAFEDIGGSAIHLSGGQTHLVQNIKITRACTKLPEGNLIFVGSNGALAASHIEIDNSGVAGSQTGIRLNGKGATSHCNIKGVKTALSVNQLHAADHVTSVDGSVSLPSGSYIASSIFSNVNAAQGVQLVTTSGFTDVSSQAGVQPLDITPPPMVKAPTVARKGNYNQIEWSAVEDPESGINNYVIYSSDKEIGRTPMAYVPEANFHGPFTVPVKITTWSDADLGNSNYSVKAINGANLLSGGGEAPIRRWTPIRGQFFDKAGNEFVIQSIETGTTVSITDIGGRKISGDDLDPPGSPKRIITFAGESMDPGPRAVVSLKLANHVGPIPPGLDLNPSAGTFSLDQETFVSLDLFDAHGKKVQSLFRGRAVKGIHSFLIPPRRRSGIYFLKMKAVGKTRVMAAPILR